MTDIGVETCVCARMRAGEGAGSRANEDSETAAARAVLVIKAQDMQRVLVEPPRDSSDSCLYFILAAFQCARGYHTTKTGLRRQFFFLI
jgi:hypothetical protein